MKSIAVKKYLTGKRPPSAACGEGSIPHSYASNFALLYLFGPVMAATATENTAKPSPMAPLSLGFAEDAGHFGAAGWANSFGHATAIGFMNFSSELALGFALHAVRFACV